MRLERENALNIILLNLVEQELLPHGNALDFEPYRDKKMFEEDKANREAVPVFGEYLFEGKQGRRIQMRIWQTIMP